MTKIVKNSVSLILSLLLFAAWAAWPWPLLAQDRAGETAPRAAEAPDAGDSASGRPAPAPLPPKPTLSEGSRAADLLTLAARTASLARRDGSVMGLAAAAELLSAAGVPGTALEPAVADAPASPAGPSRPGGAGLPDPEGGAGELYAEAAALARASSNEGLALEMESAASAAATSRRPKTGYGGRDTRSLGPGTGLVYVIPYVSSEQARVTLSAGRDHGLVLLVRDSSGREVDCGGGTAEEDDVLVCVWTPEETEEFLITVRNPTDASVGYFIATN
ncbi:MAG: hypothetical protein LBQ79_10430 [Deltaproteobacteria bacterium]|nr:hypothetical protein [Deltaproteobacteria bacterium]